jgi:hypothetical protein
LWAKLTIKLGPEQLTPADRELLGRTMSDFDYSFGLADSQAHRQQADPHSNWSLSDRRHESLDG